MMRPTTSVGPPAANGTTMVTGWVGQACAPALPAKVNSATDASTIRILPIASSDLAAPRACMPFGSSFRLPQGSLSSHCPRARRTLRLNYDLDGIVDPIFRVTNCGRQILERKRVRVDLGGVETFLRHERFGAVSCAAALPANAKQIDI